MLAPSDGPDAVEIPDAEFLLTLDADSIVLPEYCLRLVHVMMRPENSRLAVVQTPYSAFPGSSTRLERIAGATTDIQHIVHQGMSYYGATFWVGANAVIRKRALDDIVEVEHDGGVEIRRYVHGPDRHRGHRVEPGPGDPRLAAAELPGAAQLLRHSPGLRLAQHPAPPVGQRRAADPAQAVGGAPGAHAPRRAQQPRHDRCSGSTTWPRPAGAASRCCSCSTSPSPASCSARWS